MRIVRIGIMALALLPGALPPPALLAEPSPGVLDVAPSAGAILARALECAEQAERDALLARYVARHSNRTLDLDSSQAVVREDLAVYRVRPVDGEPFYELTQRNGQAATAKDLREEAERRRRFRNHFESEADLAHETGAGFALTRSLVERYRFELAGLHPEHGWALDFQPKPGELPVRRRIDRVLNRLEGTLWIHPEDFSLTRAELALREPVRVWAGLLGALTRFEGRFEQVRLAPGHWLPSRLRLEMDGWAPFRSLRKRVELDWTGYQPAP